MDEIDSILEEVSGPAQAAATQSQAAPPPSTDEIDAILGEMPAVDNLTGEDIPDAFSGKSPKSAMNKSPLTTMDRFKLSLGNIDGNIKYLQSKFDEVQEIPGEVGEIAVKKDGKWHRVDPKSGDIRDPWEMAKGYIQNPAEFMGDLADQGPIGLGIGVAAGAAALAAAPVAAAGTATAGTVAAGTAAAVKGAAAIGAGTAALRTSLGRIVGTYDATVGEQAWDIAFETMLNATGTKIMAGVKPSASFVANKLDDIAARFKDVVPQGAQDAASAVMNSPKALFKKAFSSFSVGEENFDIAIQHTKQLKNLMKQIHAMTSGNVERYHDEVTRQQTEVVKSIAQNSRAILSQIYGKMRNEIMDSVDDNFTTNFDDAINSSYSEAINRGIGKIVIGSGKEAKQLVGADAAEYLAKNGMKNARFSLLSQDEMKIAIRNGAELGDELGYLASDKDAYSIIQNYFDDMSVFAGATQRSGKKAAQALLDFKKIAADKSWSLANLEKSRDLPGVKRILDNSRVAVDRSIRKGLDQAGVATKFDKLNSTYSELSESFAPLINANHRYQVSKDPKVYEQLLGQFLSKPGKQVSKRFAVDAAIGAADEHGLYGLSQKMSQDKLNIQIGEAAKAFNPLKPQGIKDGKIRAGMGAFAAYSAMTGQPVLAGALATGAILTSPQWAKTGVALTQSLYKGQQFIANQSAKNLDNFFSNPQVMQGFTNSVIQSPLVRIQAEQGLMNQINQAGQQ